MMMQETIGRPMEILLVEDNLSDARLAIESLREGQIKHRLTLICDGEEALEFLHREGRFARAPRPDLILLDLQLPKKGGREVLEDIKLDEALRSIPVVVLTASNPRGDSADRAPASGKLYHQAGRLGKVPPHYSRT